MRPRFLSFGWMLAALVAMQTWGQIIIPKPRPGAVLWTKTVTNLYDRSALYLTADERSVVTTTFWNGVFTPLSIDLSTQSFGTLGDLARLKGELVTLSDGGMVSQPVQQGGDPRFTVTRLGIGGWSLTIDGRLGPNLNRILATKRDTLFASGSTDLSRDSGQELLLEIDGKTGTSRSNKVGNFPPFKLWVGGSPAGFVPSGP